MKFKIYHAINPTFGVGKKPKFPEEYEAVAIVEADYIGDTYRITNHIDGSWTKNHEVKELIKANPRSTSVGDVVECFSVDEIGETHTSCYYCCASVGWEEFEYTKENEV